MNTHGHHNVADAAGVPVLAEAFGRPEGRLASFYLGNWITDLSQVIDPVAGATARDKIDSLLDDAYSFIHQIYTPTKNEPKLNTMARMVAPETLLKFFLENKELLASNIQQFLNWFISPGPDGITPWYKAAEPGVLLMGYFKFVHPEEPGQPLRMDMDVYLNVFHEQFTQYFPHEHMDRPAPRTPVEIPPDSKLDPYDERKADGPMTGTRTQKPDLYRYLREDIQVIAGRLTELDLEWASDYLTREAPFPDTDPNWNLGLAKFGQALHAVEDFFAHSNFTEHASRVMGESYFPEIWTFDSYRYLKRLKKYTFPAIPKDWRQAADEDFVVTGYFDFRDTLVSLCHVAEDFLLGLKDIHPKDSVKEINLLHDFLKEKDPLEVKIVGKADKVMHDFLEVLSKPSLVMKEDSENSVVGPLRGFLEEVEGDTLIEKMNNFVDAIQHGTLDVQHTERLFSSMPVFRDIQALSPQYISPANLGEIYQAYLEYSRWMTIIQGPVGITISLFKVLKNILIFFGLPLRTLEKLAGKQLTNYAAFFGKEVLYDVLAMDRIGCHSLMAKDHGAEFLYQQMRNCAKATHYYVVKTMMRWKLQEYRDPNRPESQKWVNWLELLEHFLCNPTVNAVCPVPQQVPVGIVHELEEEDSELSMDQLLEKLRDRFKPESLMPNGLPFTDKTIFDANTLTRLKNGNPLTTAESWFTSTGEFIQVPYAELKRILIPFLKHNIAVCDPTTVGQRWFMEVMRRGWHTDIDLLHTLKFLPNRDAAEAIADTGEELRQELINLYRPNGQGNQ